VYFLFNILILDKKSFFELPMEELYISKRLMRPRPMEGDKYVLSGEV